VNGGSGTLGTVLVYYAADDDYKTAADLAFALRKSINDPRYAVRAFKSSRGIGGEGEVRYSSSGLSTLTEALAKNAGSWLSRTYGRRVAFTPTVDPRVTATGVIVILPRRASAPAVPPDPVVTVVYPAAGDPKMAEDLANFLRTLRSGWKYSVQTVRATTGPRKEGQIEYDNERMAALAQVLARDPAAWLSRAYGRRVVLQPTMSGKIGTNTVVFWLGDFGRTPKINAAAGRDHWVGSTVFTIGGGGFKTGQVIGATDRLGGEAGPIKGEYE
jgi:hypothetical protein